MDNGGSTEILDNKIDLKVGFSLLSFIILLSLPDCHVVCAAGVSKLRLLPPMRFVLVALDWCPVAGAEHSTPLCLHHP